MHSSIDLKYRPNSYFWAQNMGVTLSSQIKGAERKALYEALVAQGQAEAANELLLTPVLSQQERLAMGRLHPSFMGGEYLPNTKDQEVEIARITIASTTQDVTSVYARQAGKRIHYRVVDEYGGSTLLGKALRTSQQPLTLGQMTDFFLKAWDLLSVLEFNFEDPHYSADEIKAFVVDASSSFYADFGRLIEERIDRWIDKRQSQDKGQPA